LVALRQLADGAVFAVRIQNWLAIRASRYNFDYVLVMSFGNVILLTAVAAVRVYHPLRSPGYVALSPAKIATTHLPVLMS